MDHFRLDIGSWLINWLTIRTYQIVLAQQALYYLGGKRKMKSTNDWWKKKFVGIIQLSLAFVSSSSITAP